MSNARIELTKEQLITELKNEISTFQTQIASLKQENHNLPFLLQLLKKWLFLGPIKKLEWLQFKLKIKQEELFLLS